MPELVHADAQLLALAKPAGWLSVPGRGPGKAHSLLGVVQQRWPGARLVHRLDQATSGLMLFARSAAVQRALGAAFAQRQVHKQYEALVHGAPPDPFGDGNWHVLELPLGRDWLRRPRSRIDLRHGKPSRTLLRAGPPDPGSGWHRIWLQPVTGRSHQLRLHLLALGCPIVGDRLYSPASTAPRMMLHATQLQLRHPATGHWLALQHAAPF